MPDAEIRRSNSLKLKFGRPQPEGPNFVFAAEFRLQGRISLQRSIPEPRTLSNSVFGQNFVLRTNFVFTNEFRLQRAPNRISSSQEFRLDGRFLSSHFDFAHNLSFSSVRTISSSKASEFRLQGGTKPGPTFPGQCFVYRHLVRASRGSVGFAEFVTLNRLKLINPKPLNPEPCDLLDLRNLLP